MPAPLLAALSTPARVAAPFIRGAVRAGSGADSIFDTLRGLGIAATRIEVRAIAAAERGAIARTLELRTLPANRVIPIARIPAARTTMRRRFAFVVRVTGLDRFTGAQLIRNVTVSSSRSLTRARIEELALNLVDVGNYGSEFSPVTATLDDAMQAAESLT